VENCPSFTCTGRAKKVNPQQEAYGGYCFLRNGGKKQGDPNGKQKSLWGGPKGQLTRDHGGGHVLRTKILQNWTGKRTEKGWNHMGGKQGQAERHNNTPFGVGVHWPLHHYQRGKHFPEIHEEKTKKGGKNLKEKGLGPRCLKCSWP